MKYKEFIKYIERIVLYQSRNKKHRDWTFKRKTELNMTTRQVADKTSVSQTTASRYIRKMVKDGLLITLRIVDYKDGFKPMKFYQVKKVVDVLTSIAKKRAFLYIEKAKKIDQNNSLKYLLTINKNKKKQRLIMSVNNGAILKSTNREEIFLDQFNIKKWKPYGIAQTADQVSNFFSNIRLSI